MEASGGHRASSQPRPLPVRSSGQGLPEGAAPERERRRVSGEGRRPLYPKRIGGTGAPRGAAVRHVASAARRPGRGGLRCAWKTGEGCTRHPREKERPWWVEGHEDGACGPGVPVGELSGRRTGRDAGMTAPGARRGDITGTPRGPHGDPTEKTERRTGWRRETRTWERSWVGAGKERPGTRTGKTCSLPKLTCLRLGLQTEKPGSGAPSSEAGMRTRGIAERKQSP